MGELTTLISVYGHNFILLIYVYTDISRFSKKFIITKF